LATRDGLTGLYVIRHFREVLNQIVKQVDAEKEPLSLILIDIDDFKKINDTYGHPAGDMVLKKIAQVVFVGLRHKRPLDEIDFVARYGGEEFIIAAPELARDQGIELAERIRSAVAKKRLKLYGVETQVTVSIGTSTFPQDVEDGNGIIFS